MTLEVNTHSEKGVLEHTVCTVVTSVSVLYTVCWSFLLLFNIHVPVAQSQLSTVPHNRKGLCLVSKQSLSE